MAPLTEELIAGAFSLVAAAICGWIDGCGKLPRRANFLRRWLVYLGAAAAGLGTGAAWLALERHGPTGYSYLFSLGLGWGVAAQLSLLGRRIGDGARHRPRWVSPIPGWEGLLLRLLAHLEQYETAEDKRHLEQLLKRLAHQLTTALGDRAAERLHADYTSYLRLHYSPDERAAYYVENDAPFGDVLDLLWAIAARRNGDYLRTLSRRVHDLCEQGQPERQASHRSGHTPAAREVTPRTDGQDRLRQPAGAPPNRSETR